MIRCPNCSSLLYRRRVDEVDVDGCPSCGGIWLDKRELQALSRTPDLLGVTASRFAPGVQPALAPKRTGLCPRCSESLVPFEYTAFRGIQLDRCRKCEGVWLDHGEAPEIQNRLKSQPAMSRAREAVSERFSKVVLQAVAQPEPSNNARAPVDDPTSTAGLPVVRGSVLGEFRGGPGLGGSLTRGWRFIREAYALAWEKPVLLAPLAAGGTAHLAIGLALIVWLGRAVTAGVGFGNAVIGTGIKEWLQAHVGLAIAAFFLFLVATQLANTAIKGMTVSMVDAWLKGREPSVRIAARDVLRNAAGLAWLALVDAAVQLLTSGNRRGRRSFVAASVNAVWTTLSFLLLPVILIEDVGLRGGLDRVRRIHGRGLLQIAVGEVGLRAIAGLTVLLATGLVFLVGWAAWPWSATSALAVVCLFVVSLTTLNVFNSFARGAYYTCLYLWAAEVERVGDAATAVVPGPLAAALAR